MVMITEPVRPEELVGLAEASRRAGRTPETLKRYIDRGLLRGVWVAGRRVVLKADLDEFILRRASRRAAASIDGR